MNSLLENHFFQQAFQNKIIHVIAPASGTSNEKMEALRSIQTLPLSISSELLSNDIPYHANTDENRFQILKNALLDARPNTLVWALRGGYGCARLLENLRELPVPKHKKWVIGFSDNTALLLFLSQEWHWPVIHGSVLTQLLDPNQDPENFLRIAEIVVGNKTEQTMGPLKPLNATAKKIKTISGELTGGNLTLIEDSIGTFWEVQTNDKILFLEETGEKGYRIDRSLTHLLQAGLLTNLKGIVLGECSNPLDEAAIHLALKRFADDMNSYEIPVYKTEQFGHESKNWPIIYQSLAKISLEKDEKSFVLQMKIS